MKTPDEIKKGLECCYQMESCCGCTYSGSGYAANMGLGCSSVLGRDVIAYIQQLERERDRIKSVRDAAVKDIEDAAPCFACIHFERNGGDCIGARVCEDDVLQEALGRRYADYCFEWRGVQEVE